MLQDIIVQKDAFVEVYEIWKDLIAGEEYKKLSGRHTEIMDAMKQISENIVGFQQAVASAKSNSNRGELINWLSSADPSSNYIRARDKHQPETGNWLIKESIDFKNWENAPNSFLWLNGKGKNSLQFHYFANRTFSWLWENYTKASFESASIAN